MLVFYVSVARRQQGQGKGLIPPEMHELNIHL